MRELYYLVKRNILVFIRDYAAVFFSVLSMLIILLLMVVFLGKMNTDNVLWVLTEYGGERDVLQDEKNAQYLIQMWTLAGILAVNTFTVPLTVMQTMVRDEVNGHLASFYVAPVKRVKIVLGYTLASWLIGSGMSFLTLIIGEIYMVAQGYSILAPAAILKILAMIMLNSLVYSAVGYLLALFIHSESAWGGMLTVMGTLVGFLGAIYLPVSMLSENIVNMLKCLPVLHGTAMMRKVLTKDAMATTFDGMPDLVPESFAKEIGITLWHGETQITLANQILVLAVYAIIAIVVATIISKKRKIHDR
jgi:multidrug/hemolysin transport system permease protein